MLIVIQTIFEAVLFLFELPLFRHYCNLNIRSGLLKRISTSCRPRLAWLSALATVATPLYCVI